MNATVSSQSGKMENAVVRQAAEGNGPTGVEKVASRNASRRRVREEWERRQALAAGTQTEP